MATMSTASLTSCVITNPNSGTRGEREQLRELLEQEYGFDWWSTDEAGHARVLTRQAVDEGYDQIIIAGGDGTINEVVNALMPAKERDVRLGIIPVGTGNDLARTLGIPLDFRDAASVLALEDERRLDVIQLDAEGETRYGINVAAGGFSGQVDEKLTPELKESWGPLAFIFGAASVLPDLQGYETYVSIDDGPEESIRAYNIIVANGRTAGGGKHVAPEADPCDGMLDVVIVEIGNVLEMAGVATLLMAGNYTDSDSVRHCKAHRVRVASTPGMWFNIDGELHTKEPVTFSVIPGALRFLVGPEFGEYPE